MPEKHLDGFDEQCAASIGQRITVYLINGKAMPGVLRKYDRTTITIDSKNGVFGGTTIKRDQISTVSRT